MAPAFYVEVRQEHHLENLRDERVLIDGPRDAVDQLYDQLGHAVSGSRLAAEDDRSGGCRGARGTPQLVVDSDQVQNVQVLALVLVQPLHRYIEHRVRIYNNIGSLLDKTDQNPFVGLDGLPVPLKIDVIGEWLEAPELVFQIGQPSVTDVPRDEGAQFRIAQRDPAPRRHSVGHVEEFLR